MGCLALTREKLGAPGIEPVLRVRCLEAYLGVTAGAMAEAKRCCSCDSLHETTQILGKKFIVDLAWTCEYLLLDGVVWGDGQFWQCRMRPRRPALQQSFQ